MLAEERVALLNELCADVEQCLIGHRRMSMHGTDDLIDMPARTGKRLLLDGPVMRIEPAAELLRAIHRLENERPDVPEDVLRPRKDIGDKRAAHARDDDALRLARQEDGEPVPLPHVNLLCEPLCADRPPRRRARARTEVTDDRTRRVPVQDKRRCEVGMVCADVRQCRSVRNKRRNRRQPRIELHSHPPCRFTRGAHPRK